MMEGNSFFNLFVQILTLNLEHAKSWEEIDVLRNIIPVYFDSVMLVKVRI